jgi:23S rRNA pseudouridine1911/1915/1917 synthase
MKVDDVSMMNDPVKPPSLSDLSSGPTAFTAGDADAGLRLDKFLANHLTTLSRTRVQTLIADGQATLGGVLVSDGGYRVKSGDVVSLSVPPPLPPEPTGEDITLAVVYEDDALIVIDKPA